MISFGFALCCYKHCQYVQQCLDSIVNQPYRNIRVVLYGEGCWHHHEDPRVETLYDGRFFGQNTRVNMGLERLDTDYVTFFGVDDYLQPNVLSKVADKIEATGRAEMYYGYHTQLRSNGLCDGSVETMGNNCEVVFPPADITADTFRKSNPVAGGAVFLRLDVAREMGGFEDVLGLGGDQIMWHKVASKYRPMYLAMNIYVERIGTSHIRRPGTRAIRRWLVRKKIAKIETNHRR